MKYSIIALAALIVTIAVPAAGQGIVAPAKTGTRSSSIAPASADAAPGFQERSPRYQLRKGDSFDLDFALSPEFNQTVAVQPDGYVTLKGVGSILVEGQTVPELTETLKTAKETLDAAGVRLLGTVLHKRSFPIPDGLYRKL